MQINKIYTYQPQIHSLPKASNTISESKQVNTDALSTQLSFMGLFNRPILTTSGENVLKGFYQRTLPHKITGGFILYKQSLAKIDWSKTLIFDNEMSFIDSLDYLRATIENARYNVLDHSRVRMHGRLCDFETFKEAALVPNSFLSKLKIKGMIGQGAYSTAFLTSDNKLLKLSLKPNFPSTENFVEGVDIPIFERHIIQLPQRNENVFGAIEALAEPGEVRCEGMQENEFGKYWDMLNRNLRQHSNWHFSSDFKRTDPYSIRQVGFIGKTPYLIDHECIANRPLAEKE